MVGTVGTYDPASLLVPETQAMQPMTPQYGAGSSTWRLLPSRWHGEFAEDIPSVRSPSEANWEVRPTEYERLSDSTVFASSFPLTECLRASAPGAVIRINGVIPEPANRYQLGGGSSALHSYAAFHVAAAAPLQVTIVGAALDGTDEIPAFEIWDNVGGIPAGITELRLQNLTIRNSNGADAPITGRVGEEVELIRMTDCYVTGDDSGAGGFGMLSGIDCRTRAKWDLRDVHIGSSPNDSGLSLAAPGSEKYAVKIDCPKQNSSFTRCTMERSWEGMFLIRAEGATNPGLSGQGILLFDRCEATNVWGNVEDRHAHFHIQGHHGPVVFRECSSTAGPADAAGGFSRTSILVAAPEKAPEWILDANGFTTTRVVVIEHDVDLPLASGNEAHIACHGVGTLELHSWDHSGSAGAAVRNVDVSPSWLGTATDFSVPTLEFVIANPAQGIASVLPPVANYGGWNPSGLLVYYADTPIQVDAAVYQVLGSNFLFPGISFNQGNGVVSGTPSDGSYDPPVSLVFFSGAFFGAGAQLTGQVGAFQITVEDFDGSFVSTLPETKVQVGQTPPQPIADTEVLLPQLDLTISTTRPDAEESNPLPSVGVVLDPEVWQVEIEQQQVFPEAQVQVGPVAPGVQEFTRLPRMTINVTGKPATLQRLDIKLPQLAVVLRERRPTPNASLFLPSLGVEVGPVAPDQNVGGFFSFPEAAVQIGANAPTYQLFPSLSVEIGAVQAVPFAQIFVDKVLDRGRISAPKPKRVNFDR